jgi:dihydrofolate reductase
MDTSTPAETEESAMSDLMVDFIMSLDGYGAAEGWPGFWGMEGPEYLAWIGDDEAESHDALMGATTYRLMSGFAAEMPDDPGMAGLTTLPKVVFSSTLEEPLSWANSELVAEDAVAAVRARKDRGARPMRTIGSISLCRSLLVAGLVDRFRVVVFPVITGATGRDRIFDAYPDVALELVENRLFDGRLQLLEYVPTVLDGPPGDGSS